MKKRNRKHEKRIKKLIVICVLSAIILTVSTYAWFIGMQTVSVNAFEVNIASTEGLLLSIDGIKFEENVTINAETDLSEKYETNTNKWTALKPVSTIGTMDKTNNGSRMVIFEKSSLTTSAGGYRILSEQLKNYDKDNQGYAEADGYVVFDLFVKNMSGEAYYKENKPANEEAIYLTLDSSVNVGNSGVENTGIENSVRVAFAQIGRVEAPETNSLDVEDEDEAAVVETIQGIDCVGGGEVTGICRNAQIWEPNERKHIANANSWFTESCKIRTGANAFGEACAEIEDGTFYETYAIAKTIPEDLEYPVDVYDGEKYNTDSTSITAGYLNAVDTFTDSEKILSGSSRPTFMTLAPNSVTKVRVYVYLEGQDVDNYDFASLGKQISINFGFTKERFTAEDIDYIENPNVALDDVLYSYYYVSYTATDADSLKLPENVEYVDNGDTKVLKIHKSITKSFTFEDGGATVNATRNTDAGYVDWIIE